MEWHFIIALGFAFHLVMETDLLFCSGSLIHFLNKNGPVQTSVRGIYQPSACLLTFKQAISQMVILEEWILGICCNEHFYMCQVSKAGGKAQGSPAKGTGLLLLWVSHQHSWAELILPCVHSGMSAVATSAEPDQERAGGCSCGAGREGQQVWKGQKCFLGVLLRGEVLPGGVWGLCDVLWRQELPASVPGHEGLTHLHFSIAQNVPGSGCISRQRHQGRL